MKFKQKIQAHAERTTRAKAMGGPQKLARRKEEGHLNVRERIDALLDAGTFRESGLFGTSYIPAMRDATPADGKVVRQAGIHPE
jgi:acetyl-CoA carboxylase carboxyltransferase component